MSSMIFLNSSGVLQEEGYIALQNMKTFENQAKKKVPLACDAPPVKSRDFCPKHMTY